MAIKEIECIYGSVLYRLIETSGREISVGHIPNDTRGFYLVNNKIPLCIKYSTKRVSPWSFTFTKSQQNDLQEVKDIYKNAVVVFVCGHDGMCAIKFEDFKSVLDYYHEDVEHVIIKRKKGEKYSVSGKDGDLGFKIGDKDFSKLIDEIIDCN